MSETPAAQTLTAATPTDTPIGANEIPLKQAATLVAKNERTIRRKLDDGTLKGRKKTLETGGELWLVDRDSLAAVFSDAGPSAAANPGAAATPYDFESFQESLRTTELPLPNIVQPPLRGTPAPPPVETPVATTPAAPVAPPGGTVGQPTVHVIGPKANHELTEFLLKEHASLKEGHQQELSAARTGHKETLASLQDQLQQRETRITVLQEQNGQLRQELGETRGRAETEAKMREWLQGQVERMRLQLEAPKSYVTQGVPVDSNVIEVESPVVVPSNHRPDRAATKKSPPTAAIVGFILFLLATGLGVAYSLHFIGGR